jgi:hypothetical protein
MLKKSASFVLASLPGTVMRSLAILSILREKCLSLVLDVQAFEILSSERVFPQPANPLSARSDNR